MPTRTLRFYFDYISSNAYIAWTQLPALAKRYDLAVEPVPVLFAGLLEAYGQLGPAEVPVKAAWMAKNNLRKAVRLGIPLRPPVHHPFNPLLALRISSLLHAVTIACLVLVGIEARLSFIWWGAVVVAAALLVWEHSLVSKDDLSRVDAAFFTANGFVSVTLAACGIAQVLLRN